MIKINPAIGMLTFILVTCVTSCEFLEFPHSDEYGPDESSFINIPDGAIEYLSDKAVVSILMGKNDMLVLSSKPCDTCTVPPHMSYVPTIEQLTFIHDSGYIFEEPAAVRSISTDHNGNYYMATTHEVFRMTEPGDYASILETGDFHFNKFVFDSANNIWLYGHEGIAFWDGTSLEVFNAGNSDLPGDIVHGMAIDHSGNVWVSLDFKGLLKISEDVWTIVPNAGIPGLTSKSYLSEIVTDHENNLWFSVHYSDTTSNILKFDQDSQEFVYPCPDRSGIINKDAKGTIWVINSRTRNGVLQESELQYLHKGEWISQDVSSIEFNILTVNANYKQVLLGTTKGLEVISF